MSRTADDRRAAEHYESYLKSAFGAACKTATKMGWTWVYEGEVIVVSTGTHVLECADRRDFIALVQESRTAR